MKNDHQGLIDSLFEGVYFVDKERRITYWNKSAEEISGFTAHEILGSRCSDNVLIHVDDRGTSLCNSSCPVAGTIQDGREREAEVYLHHKLGHRVPVLTRVVPLYDESGAIAGAAELFKSKSSSSEMLRRIKELEDLALIDRLTRLSNRHHIEGELEARLQEKKRYGLSFGLLFMDIDGFKRLNDTYGHQTGDRMLVTVSNTLRSATRPFDLIGRWGGEEFVGIIRNVDREVLGNIGERCRTLVEKSHISIENHIVNVTLSIGGTVARQQDTIQTILKRADELMYTCKRGGGNCLVVDEA